MSSTTTALPTGTWSADALHSSVDFKVKHMGISTFRSGFSEVTASYDAAAGKLVGTVPVSSITITQEDFRGHLFAPDFFDVENTPNVEFEATGLELGTGDVEVPGKLTIKGVTKDVVAKGSVGEPSESIDGSERVELELKATVDRRDFGLNWQAELPNGKLALANDVTLEVVLQLKKEA